jgi:hypothetical protein
LEPRLVLVRKEGNLVGGLPNFLIDIGELSVLRKAVSIPRGVGGPIVVGNRVSVLDAILNAVSHLCSTTVVGHQITAEQPELLDMAPYLAESGYRSTVLGKFVLPLDCDWERILDQMHKDRRYNIRKAHDQDYRVKRLAPTPDVLDAFYDAYLTKLDELGADPDSRDFFQTLADEMDECLLILSAEVDGQRRGFHLYLLDEYTSKIRHFLMTVTRDDYEFYPGELMHEHAIKLGLEQEYDSYDFGGYGADFRSGGTEYKRQFGGQLVPVLRWHRSASRVYGLARNLYDRLGR